MGYLRGRLCGYLFLFLVSLLIGVFTGFISRKCVLRWKMVSPQGVPLSGGINIALPLFFISIPVLLSQGLFTKEIGAIFTAFFLIFIFGLVDDKLELSVSVKFAAQATAVLILALCGIGTKIAHIGDWANILITFLWVMGITNAFNHLDIMDGLAGGVALTCSVGFLAAGFMTDNPQVVLLSFVLIGAISGFLLQNFSSKRIFMGNSGSHFLGFVLAVIALAISYAPLERKIALLSPIVILGFPLFDTIFVILMRMNKRMNPFKKSNDHMALRLLQKGYSKEKTLMVMLTISIFYVAAGLMLTKASNVYGVCLIAIVFTASTWMALTISKVRIDG